MTPSQKQALEHLQRHGGEGAIDKHGALVAGGVRLKFLADTWLRLMSRSSLTQVAIYFHL